MSSTPPHRPLERPERLRQILNVPDGVEYHRVLAGEKRRIGRGLLAIALLALGFVLFPTALGLVAAVIDQQVLGRTGYTPMSHAAGLVGLAALIPWSMAIQRWLYGVRGASLHSVAGHFRFGLLGRGLLVLGPVWLLVIVTGFLAPVEESPWTQADLLAFAVITLVLTPLQAAGEEYGFRGLMFRVVGGWTRSSVVGLTLGVVVTAVAFSLTHGTLDPFLLTWYLVLFSTMALLTWRTGGLEVPVLLHAILNTATFLFAVLLRLDIGGALQSREVAVGSAANLIPAVTIILITAVIWWMTRRSGPARTPRATASAPESA